MRGMRWLGAIAAVSAPMCVGAGALAGDLAPPLGPVTPTMKTLDEVEARIAVNATNTPGTASNVHVIDEPGSYYLTGNIIGEPGKNGIFITSNDVTLDLNGFTLLGVNGSLDGVWTSSHRINICVRNGAVRAWGDDGVAVLADNSVFEDLRISQCGGGGLISFGSQTQIVRRVAVLSVGSNAAAYSREGIHVGESAVVESCTVRGTGEHGVQAGDEALIRGCTIHSAGGSGIETSARAIVEDCRVSSCGHDGIRVSEDSVVRANQAVGCGFSGQTYAGIAGVSKHVRVEDNHVTNCVIGVRTDGTGSVVVRNSAGANTTNYQFAPGTLAGPIVTGATIGTDERPHANYSW